MRRSSLLLLVALPLASLATPSASLIWHQTEPDATYDSAAISLHGPGSSPTFAVSTSGLDTWPVMLEVYNASGSPLWTYTAITDNATAFLAVMARHAEAGGVGAVDMIACEGDEDGAGQAGVVWVRGFASTGTSAEPAWSVQLTEVRLVSGLAVSDDGSSGAVSLFVYDAQTGAVSPQLLVLDAQSGAVRVNVTRAEGGPGGPVSISETGAWVAWTQGDSVFVYDGTSGALRGEAIQMGWNTAAQLNDDGSFVAFSGQDTAAIWAWDAASGVYTLNSTIAPAGTWYSESCAVSSNSPTYGPIAVFGWATFDARQAHVTVYQMSTGTLLANYTSLPNAQLQTSANVRIDGDLVGISLWGDSDDVPTAVVLQAGVAEPVFTFVTPGSMAGTDIVVDRQDPTVAYFSVAGRLVPANIMGKGGDAYTWKLTGL